MRHYRTTPQPVLSRSATADAEEQFSRAQLAQPSPKLAMETARYIAEMTAELAGMAGAAKLEMLAYFLDMARNEAEMAARLPADN